MKKVGVAILGLGTVGGGTYEILTSKKDDFLKLQGLEVSVESVLELNAAKIEKYKINPEIVTKNIAEVVGNPAVDIVVEVIGGIEPAKTFILTALKHGKTVVTANKELIAKYWHEIEATAKQNNAGFYYEASCVGGVPVIRTLMDSMQGNDIVSITGIINGTTNFIMSKMANEGSSFDEVLKEAQAAGFAEADPTADVEGYDAAYKLSILSSLAFNVKVPLSKVYREGITKISGTDIAYGKELGYVLKLLGIGKKTDKGIEVRVHPTFIKYGHPLANVNGSFNAVHIVGDNVGDVMLYGRGAGALPTGSAIVSDIIYAACRTEHFYVPFINNKEAEEKIAFSDDFISEYYLRLTVKDKPGVLASISGVFGEYNVSITDVIQKEESATESGVPLIFITHRTSENSLKAAIAKISKFTDIVESIDAVIRVEK